MHSFEKLFISKVPISTYEVRRTLSYTANISRLQEYAFLKHNCKFIYEKAENIFGEDYGEKLIDALISKKFKITNMSKYTYKEFPFVEESLFLDFIAKKSIFGRHNSYNFFNIFSEIEHEIFNYIRNNKSFILPDLLVILSIFYHRVVKSKVISGLRFAKSSERFLFISQAIINFLGAISPKESNIEEPITICILDKSTFNRLISERDYVFDSFTAHQDTKLKPYYKHYKEFIKVFIKAYKKMKSKGLTPCKFVYYINTSKNTRERFIEHLNKLGVNEYITYFVFKDYYIGKEINLDDALYTDLLKACIEKSKLQSIDLIKLKQDLNTVLKTDPPLTISDLTYDQKPLFKFAKKNRCPIDKFYIPYDVRNIDSLFFKKKSEVIVDLEKIYDDLLTFDQLLDKVAENYIDAQVINQFRLQLFDIKDCVDCKCNVKFINVKTELIPALYNRLFKETKTIKSAYSINFTYEIERKFN